MQKTQNPERLSTSRFYRSASSVGTNVDEHTHSPRISFRDRNNFDPDVLYSPRSAHRHTEKDDFDVPHSQHGSQSPVGGVKRLPLRPPTVQQVGFPKKIRQRLLSPLQKETFISKDSRAKDRATQKEEEDGVGDAFLFPNRVHSCTVDHGSEEKEDRKQKRGRKSDVRKDQSSRGWQIEREQVENQSWNQAETKVEENRQRRVQKEKDLLFQMLALGLADGSVSLSDPAHS